MSSSCRSERLPTSLACGTRARAGLRRPSRTRLGQRSVPHVLPVARAAGAVVAGHVVAVPIVHPHALVELRRVLDLILRAVDVDALLVRVDPVDRARREDDLLAEDPRPG